MSDTLLLIAGFVTAYAGFALLALSVGRNWKKVSEDKAPSKWTVARVAGYGLLALALLPLLFRDEISFAILLWILGLSATAMAVAFTLAWRAHWLRPFARFVRVAGGR
ncbi:MAG: DUF3325 domain-containing protein [Bacteroidota bacterium]